MTVPSGATEGLLKDGFKEVEDILAALLSVESAVHYLIDSVRILLKVFIGAWDIVNHQVQCQIA